MEIQIFEKEGFGQIRITDNNGEPWFIATDVATALGYEKPNNAVNMHCKKVNKFNYPKTGQPVNIIPESDLYRLIMRSKLESAESFQDWVVEEVLPSIRKKGSYAVNDHTKALPAAQFDFRIADEIANILRFSDVSRIIIAKKVMIKHGCDLSLLPEYAENTKACLAASDLLKKHQVKITAQAFNKLMMAEGLIQENERTGSKGNIKKFKTLTEKGLEFGQNDTSDKNTRETQPRYFIDKFESLLSVLGVEK